MKASRRVSCVFSGLFLLAVALGGAGCVSRGTGGVAVDAGISMLAGSAWAAWQRGETAQAAGLYERALARARLIDDAAEAARNAYNLALCRTAEGRFDEARALLAQARVLLPPRSPEAARTWVAEAETAQRQGKLEDVQGLVQRGWEAGADRSARAQSHLLLADLACVRGDWPTARRELAVARRELRGLDVPELEGRAEGVAACLARSEGDSKAMASALERRAGWCRRAGRFDDMATALAAAGEAYRAAGREREAYPCLMRAAASLKERGRGPDASVAAIAALAIAQALDEPEWVAGAAALVAEIKGR